MNVTQSIVVVGGGFAGTNVARALEGKLPPDYSLLVISGHDQKPAPPTALFAVREAACVAANLLATIAGQPTRVFRGSAEAKVRAPTVAAAEPSATVIA